MHVDGIVGGDAAPFVAIGRDAVPLAQSLTGRVGVDAMQGTRIVLPTHTLAEGDVLVVTQKIVSKAEGRLVDPAAVEPSAFAHQIAAQGRKDAHFQEVVLRESRRIVKMANGVLITETHHGLVCANSGVDESNVAGGRVVCLLPEDPDASAARLRWRFRAGSGGGPRCYQ